MSYKRRDFTRSFIFPALFLVLGAGGLPLSRASPPVNCSIQMSANGESSLLKANDSWSALFAHHEMFSACDDGVLGEGYSDAVVKLFAQSWSQFGAFAALAKKHPDFQAWALRHIDATASGADLDRILVNTADCTNERTEQALCKAVRQAARNALAELGRARR